MLIHRALRAAVQSRRMISGYLVPSPADELPYRVIVRRYEEVVRIQPVWTRTEGNRTLTELLRVERRYDRELRWYEPCALELDD